MVFISQHSVQQELTSDRQWQIYKQLELVPDAITHPYDHVPLFLFGLDVAWRSLIQLLVAELVDVELQTEYLERCWQLDMLQHRPSSQKTLQRLWKLMS
jgi:hypothetical protein